MQELNEGPNMYIKADTPIANNVRFWILSSSFLPDITHTKKTSKVKDIHFSLIINPTQKKQIRGRVR
jgi:hypothetical protein